MYDIAIIGGGVVGGLIAHTLARYQLRICILEKTNDVATGASSANSGIVHAGFDAKEGTLKAKLNLRGSSLMPRLCRELGVKYRNNGSLVIAFSDEDRAVLDRLLERGAHNGVTGLRILDAGEAHAMEPNLSEGVIAALYAPTGAIVCPYDLTIAAIGNAMDNGATLLTSFEVTDIEPTESGYRIASPDRVIDAKAVINAAGLYADAIARMIGDDSFSIHPRRGEYVLLDRECGGIVNATIFRTPTKMGKGILVTPTVDGNLLMGPTSLDSEDKTDRATSAEGLSHVLREADRNVDPIPRGRVITSFCGLRAVGSTGDFIIRFARPGFLHVAGIESPGLSAAPAIAEYVKELLEESGMELIPKAHPVLTRTPPHAFHEMSTEEKNEVIRRDPAYGQIVCRCEGISEGEIRAAIRQNPRPRDLDGVKRRTRAQMGRCQGGFCSPSVAELLAEEWGIPYEAVTKCGGNSHINLARTKGAGTDEAN